MRIATIGIESQSHSLVRELARQSDRPLEEVREIYETQFRLLERQARIKTFLPIIAARHVRDILATH
jgi:uncharacterized protein DUF3562